MKELKNKIKQLLVELKDTKYVEEGSLIILNSDITESFQKLKGIDKPTYDKLSKEYSDIMKVNVKKPSEIIEELEKLKQK